MICMAPLVPEGLFALVVEDRQEDFDLVAMELRRSGFISRCLRVETEAEYVAQLEAKPDIILSDYSLPGFDALRALKLMQDAGLDIPFIVLTGAVSEETAREIDCEVRRLIDEQYDRVRIILGSQEAILRQAASVLLTKETITGEELKTIVAHPMAPPVAPTGTGH